MAEDFNNESNVIKANDTKGSANIYYTIAMEKIRDVSGILLLLLLLISNIFLLE